MSFDCEAKLKELDAGWTRIDSVYLMLEADIAGGGAGTQMATYVQQARADIATATTIARAAIAEIERLEPYETDSQQADEIIGELKAELQKRQASSAVLL